MLGHIWPTGQSLPTIGLKLQNQFSRRSRKVTNKWTVLVLYSWKWGGCGPPGARALPKKEASTPRWGMQTRQLLPHAGGRRLGSFYPTVGDADSATSTPPWGMQTQRCEILLVFFSLCFLLHMQNDSSSFKLKGKNKPWEDQNKHA